jgi:hypothetical protein
MPWLRVGYFENFGGDDTLLFAGDAVGLRRMTQVFRELSGVLDSPTDVACLAGVTVCGDIRIILERSSNDEGLRSRGAGQYAWRRTPDGWIDLAAKLALLAETSAGHQYLDGPGDDVQVVAAIGEYEEDWWGWSAS